MQAFSAGITPTDAVPTVGTLGWFRCLRQLWLCLANCSAPSVSRSEPPPPWFMVEETKREHLCLYRRYDAYLSPSRGDSPLCGGNWHPRKMQAVLAGQKKAVPFRALPLSLLAKQWH